jgi:hypothetical protein
VDSLSQRISRDEPEKVAGPLLKLHGFTLNDSTDKEEMTPSALTMTSTREKASRLHRQSTLLTQIASRVEGTLQRGVTRMESSTTRLSRVLELSSTLKMIMRLQFEARKVCSDGALLDWDTSKSRNSNTVDLRDLTRAAASVAIMEELLSHPALSSPNGETIDIVEKLRPGAESVASSVRKAAAGLMLELQNHPTSSSSASLSRLGATLQVYFHLGELHDATWKSVSHALSMAEKASSALFHPGGIQKMKQAVEKEARSLAEEEASRKEQESINTKSGGGGSGNATKLDPRQKKKQVDAIYTRLYARKLREKRSALSSKWSTAVADAASRVWNLHRVLVRRNDAVSRRNFLDVVAEKDVPEEFRGAELWMEQRMGAKSSNFSLFSLFWVQFCIGLGGRIQRLLKYDGGSMEGDVASLYPAVRAASLEMVTELYDVMQMGLSSLEDVAAFYSSSGGGAAAAAGVMGGSACLEESVFLGTVGLLEEDESNTADGAAGGFFGGNSADAWTHDGDASFGVDASQNEGARSGGSASASHSSTLAVFSSPEWIALQGGRGGEVTMGLLPLQTSFLKESKKRLFAPLEYMFPEAVSVDEDGNAQKVLPTLPSRYDLAKLDTNIREELSLADPRMGGGDLTMTTMISGTVVDMLHEFCNSARRAISEVDQDRVVDPRTGSASEPMKHNLRVANVISTLATFVRNAPENTFVTPYRPAQSPQHEEASHSCSVALLPALQEMEGLVKTSILNPLCYALNLRINAAIAKMHRGIYLSETADAKTTSFVQLHLTDHFEQIANAYLANLPAEYASIVASTIATFSIYSFVSNAALIRPLGESARLRLTQDLADFEMALEQFVFKGGTSSLSQITDGKPYAELRAVRQILYWNMLDDKTLSPAEVARSLLREVWVKDFRPSTLFHFLFSFAPNLLSSPHHFKRMDAGEYVGTLVKLDGSIEDGEASAWMTCMACCDAYQQRESVDGRITDGDRRISAILMILGPELRRRRDFNAQ